ncbi:MAG: lysophospholipid acyltransferase family protein [Candidatus Omnitrophota bacterium]
MLKKIVLNITFYALLLVFTLACLLVLTVPVVLVRLLAGKRMTQKWLRSIMLGYGYGVVRCFTFPFVRIEYRDDEEGKKMGPCVYVSNHRSFSDGFLVAHLKVEGVQVVNIWPFRIPIIGIMARLAGYLSINTLSFEDFSRKACELLGQGVSIVAFPEGSRSGNRTLKPFHGAIFRVALAARCPIVPVCITGNENIPPRGSCLLNPGTVKIHKLPALKWEDYGSLTPFHLKNKVRDMIQKEIEVMEAAC